MEGEGGAKVGRSCPADGSGHEDLPRVAAGLMVLGNDLGLQRVKLRVDIHDVETSILLRQHDGDQLP